MRRGLAFPIHFIAAAAAALIAWSSFVHTAGVRAASHPDPEADFHTSDRCVACHNGLKTPSGEDVSIGLAWRSSIMANAGRDPYWQASVRRESIDHPEASDALQDECSTCHMPMQHLIDRAENRKTQVFGQLPHMADDRKFTPAADGVSCSVCHQIEANGLGTPQTFSGNVDVAGPYVKDDRPEYGPFDVDAGHQTIMRTSTAGFVPQEGQHIRDSALCGSCHTLYTVARGPGGKAIGKLPEQMPYLEWLHSDYRSQRTCQECHMPVVQETVAIAATFGPPRQGMHRHIFVGGNFLLQHMLQDHRTELAVNAPGDELSAAADRTSEFLRTQSARVTIEGAQESGGSLSFVVAVQNLTGHKLPTAYPSRRAWLHVAIRDAGGKVIFESGALRPDGSIVGNRNDTDPHQYEQHFSVITSPDQVQIFESILKDSQGRVTTGLISAIGYLKDNRILPAGFNKQTAQPDIAVIGAAANDASFTGGVARTRYEVRTGVAGPFRIEAELWYQPIGFRWAHNLAPYQATETRRFLGYYETAAQNSAVILAKASAATR